MSNPRAICPNCGGVLGLPEYMFEGPSTQYDVQCGHCGVGLAIQSSLSFSVYEDPVATRGGDAESWPTVDVVSYV